MTDWVFLWTDFLRTLVGSTYKNRFQGLGGGCLWWSHDSAYHTVKTLRRCKNKVIISSTQNRGLGEEKGGPSLSRAANATVQKSTMSPVVSQYSTPGHRAFVFIRRKMFYQAHPFLYIASTLTTCGQGKLSIFISCWKLESLICHYQITAYSFKPSCRELFWTFKPF